MRRAGDGGPWRPLTALVALGALVASACIHDWQEWLPAGAGGAGTGTAGTGAGGGTHTGTLTGGGGTGTGTVPGTCPTIPGTTTMVKVVTLLSPPTAMCIDRTEVTKGQYLSWLETSPDSNAQPAHCAFNTGLNPFRPQDPEWAEAEGGTGVDLPVGGTDWCDALAYCTAVGKRLCGEVGTGNNVTASQFADPYQSEWSNACTERGGRTYPYGGEYDEVICNGIDSGNDVESVTVGTLSGCQTPSGVFDLSGNIWEWENSCSGEIGATDLCKTRGGGFNSGGPELLCGKDNPTQRSTETITVGFRCCAPAEL